MSDSEEVFKAIERSNKLTRDYLSQLMEQQLNSSDRIVSQIANLTLQGLVKSPDFTKT